ncbi:polysaccharide deacetylase family protein [Streptomyces sp. H27-G5]|nr:polysaccharide deacetylase family protein [Streptomyces sp. H27-G5]MCY0924276.1 polysaccharide deacetylase family protein [Streptomyces sp. H27-G5]
MASESPAAVDARPPASTPHPTAAAHTSARASSAVARAWGLATPPLTPPRPPTLKPAIGFRKGFEVSGPDTATLPPVFTTIPTTDKVVFLTIDDGAEKDPEFLRMTRELHIPYTAFLTDSAIKDNYGYFRRMQGTGTHLNNHTLNHRYLRGMTRDGQQREICGQQNIIQKVFGTAPKLFRPPYGAYDANTLRAAKSCGVTHVPLWNAEAFPDHMEWREADRDLHPGDVILTHFRGPTQWKAPMTDALRQILRVATDRGYALARLEDYLPTV